MEHKQPQRCSTGLSAAQPRLGQRRWWQPVSRPCRTARPRRRAWQPGQRRPTSSRGEGHPHQPAR
eukprot:8778905-Alexandrium_andersonii.AAC.1